MSKEISKAFRERVKDFLNRSPHSLTKLHETCVENGYHGLFEFMKSTRSISCDNKNIVEKSIETLRG